MKDTDTNLQDIIEQLEEDVILLWNTGYIVEVIDKDLEYINLILLAVFHEKEYWQSIGLSMGEA